MPFSSRLGRRPAVRTRIARASAAVLESLESRKLLTAISWNNAAGGDWNVASNWSTNSIPTSADDVSITLAGSYSVTLGANATVRTLTLGGVSGAQTLAVSNSTLTLNVSGSIGALGTAQLTNASFSGLTSLSTSGLILARGQSAL